MAVMHSDVEGRGREPGSWSWARSQEGVSPEPIADDVPTCTPTPHRRTRQARLGRDPPNPTVLPLLPRRPTTRLPCSARLSPHCCLSVSRFQASSLTALKTHDSPMLACDADAHLPISYPTDSPIADLRASETLNHSPPSTLIVCLARSGTLTRRYPAFHTTPRSSRCPH